MIEPLNEQIQPDFYDEIQDFFSEHPDYKDLPFFMPGQLAQNNLSAKDLNIINDTLGVGEFVNSLSDRQLIEKIVFDQGSNTFFEENTELAYDRTLQMLNEALKAFQQTLAGERVSLEDCSRYLVEYQQSIQARKLEESALQLISASDTIPKAIIAGEQSITEDLLVGKYFCGSNKVPSHLMQIMTPANMRQYLFSRQELAGVHQEYWNDIGTVVANSGLNKDRWTSKKLIEQLCKTNNLNNNSAQHREIAADYLANALVHYRKINQLDGAQDFGIERIENTDIDSGIETQLRDEPPVVGSITVLPPGFNINDTTVTFSITDVQEHKVPQPSKTAIAIATAVFTEGLKGAYGEYSYLMDGDVTIKDLIETAAKVTGYKSELEHLGPIVIDFIERYGQENQQQYLSGTHIEKLQGGFAGYIKSRFLDAPEVFFCNMVKDITTRLSEDKQWLSATHQHLIKAELTELIRSSSGIADLLFRFYGGVSAGYDAYKKH